MLQMIQSRSSRFECDHSSSIPHSLAPRALLCLCRIALIPPLHYTFALIPQHYNFTLISLYCCIALIPLHRTDPTQKVRVRMGKAMLHLQLPLHRRHQLCHPHLQRQQLHPHLPLLNQKWQRRGPKGLLQQTTTAYPSMARATLQMTYFL